MKVLITGACGYIGSQLVSYLQHNEPAIKILATDIKESPLINDQNFEYFKADLRTLKVGERIKSENPDVVIHLAAIVAPTKTMTREFLYDVEVSGSEKILEACVEAGVKKIITTSSGAAYGYYKDNPDWISEKQPLRGNKEFAYSWHKRKVEEIMAELRTKEPQLKQLILRVSTIMGANTKNDITNLFDKKAIIGIKGSDTPFVIIWDEDLVRLLALGITSEIHGIYNVSGDGYITLKDMAKLIGKPFFQLSANIIKGVLKIGKALGISRYGPEQVRFIQYRPSLDNSKMKRELNFQPSKTSEEAFRYYAEKNGLVKA